MKSLHQACVKFEKEHPGYEEETVDVIEIDL
jgi:hypothetical protein